MNKTPLETATDYAAKLLKDNNFDHSKLEAATDEEALKIAKSQRFWHAVNTAKVWYAKEYGVTLTAKAIQEKLLFRYRMKVRKTQSAN